MGLPILLLLASTLPSLTHSQENYTGPLPLNTPISTILNPVPLADPALISVSTTPSPYGPPLINGAGWDQWPDDCSTKAVDVCWGPKMTPDTWSWAFSDTCLGGLYMPRAYYEEKKLGEGYSDTDCLKIVRDLIGAAWGAGLKYPRLGYNLRVFPGDPVVKGVVTSERPQGFVVNGTGEPVDAAMPSFVLVGYPTSTELCYEYYGNPERDPVFAGDCAKQDARNALRARPESEAPEGEGRYDYDNAINASPAFGGFP